MTEVKVLDLLMCLNDKLYFDCFKVFYGSSITFLIDFEFRTLNSASTGSGELCCMVTAFVLKCKKIEFHGKCEKIHLINGECLCKIF